MKEGNRELLQANLNKGWISQRAEKEATQKKGVEALYHTG